MMIAQGQCRNRRRLGKAGAADRPTTKDGTGFSQISTHQRLVRPSETAIQPSLIPYLYLRRQNIVNVAINLARYTARSV
jgi:hypothetical protein